MKWDEIQTVEAVVRTGSVEAAGRELSLQHSSISRRISGIEERLGAALFVRGARLTPTPLAERIASHAAVMKVQAAEVHNLIATEQRSLQDRLVITTSDTLAPLLFFALSNVSLSQAVEVVVSDEERELVAGHTDLALRPSHKPRETLRGRRLGRLQIGLYQTSNASTRWILPSPTLRAKASMRWWRHVPKEAVGAVSCDSLLGLRDACRAGLGRAALPSFLAFGDPRLKLIENIEGGPPLWLLSPASRDIAKSLKRTKSALFHALRSVEGAFV